MAKEQSESQRMAAHWKSQIEQCDKETNKWHKRGEKILRHYRDERDDNTVGVARRLNLFWANMETLKPAIYSKTPVPICERRFLDKDPTGRTASTILERNLRYEVQMSGFDASLDELETIISWLEGVRSGFDIILSLETPSPRHRKEMMTLQLRTGNLSLEMMNLMSRLKESYSRNPSKSAIATGRTIIPSQPMPGPNAK